MGPPKKDDISREKTILMTSLRIYRASAVSSPEVEFLEEIQTEVLRVFLMLLHNVMHHNVTVT